MNVQEGETDRRRKDSDNSFTEGPETAAARARATAGPLDTRLRVVRSDGSGVEPAETEWSAEATDAALREAVERVDGGGGA